MLFGLILIAYGWKKIYAPEFKNLKKNKYFIYANLISLSRIAFSPIVILLLINNKTLLAAIIYGLGYLTDGIDGFVARKYNVTSQLGRKLDPLGSSALVDSTIITLLILYPLIRIPVFMIWALAWTITHLSRLIAYLADEKYKSFIKLFGLFSFAVILDLGTLCLLAYLSAGLLPVMLTIILTVLGLILFKKHIKYKNEIKAAFSKMLEK